MGPVLRAARLGSVAMALGACLGCDPFDVLPPPKHQQWTCGEICTYGQFAFGCTPETAPECVTIPSCTTWCEGNGDITQELLNCMSPESLGLDMSKPPESNLFAAGIAQRRYHCEQFLGLPDTSTGVFQPPGVTTTPTTTTTTLERVGATVSVDGVTNAGTNPRLGAWFAASPLVDDGLYPAPQLVWTEPLNLPMDVELPAPDPGFMGDVLFTGRGVFVLVLAWDDLDADGTHSPGEPILAGATPMPVWNEGGADAYSWPQGWSAAEFGPGEVPLYSEPVFTDLVAAPLVLQPPPSADALSVSGTSDSFGITTQANLICTVSELESNLLPGRPVNQPLPAAGQPFTIDVSGPLDPSRVDTGGDLGIGLEYLLTADDVDGDGAYTAGEPLISSICAAPDTLAALVWLEQPQSPEGWYAAWVAGLDHGWNAVGLDSSGDLQPLSAVERTQLFTATELEDPCAALP